MQIIIASIDFVDKLDTNCYFKVIHQPYLDSFVASYFIVAKY